MPATGLDSFGQKKDYEMDKPFMQPADMVSRINSPNETGPHLVRKKNAIEDAGE